MPRAPYKRKNPPKTSHPLYRYRQYLQRAGSKDLPFELTPEYFNNLLDMPCIYCGLKGGTVDRVDPKKGYTIINSVPACWPCNCMKYSHPLDRFYRLVKNVYEYNNLSSYGTIDTTEVLKDSMQPTDKAFDQFSGLSGS